MYQPIIILEEGGTYMTLTFLVMHMQDTCTPEFQQNVYKTK